MMARNFVGRRVTVLGGGVSGTAAAKLLVRLGARVFVSDRQPLSAELQTLAVASELGHSTRIAQADLVVSSPGVPENVLALAGAAPLVGELELAYSLLAESWPPKTKLCAVTGTNGKTTTTALIGHLLQIAGKKVFVGGNIGVALSSLALECLDRSPHEFPEFIVLEVSSFQAEGLRTLAADVSVYLNLTPDHLDRYPNLDAYSSAKARLFALQRPEASAVLNADDERVAAVATPARRSFFSTASASGEAHLQNADTGVALGATYALGRGALRGLHNRQNQLAAILAAQSLGLAPMEIQSGLDSFAGVEHRIEFVATVGKVSYFNDSKATNDDAACKALVSFDRPIVWLAGGRDKHGGYAGCATAARGRVKTAIVFGEAAALIASAMSSVCKVEPASDLASAVNRAAQLAQPGDVVLLSPACSSYDQFKNYEERGRVFKALVRAL